ncbi:MULTISPECIES: hypothetical protein [Bacillales]|uniref:hypothetical protein n=1 Tax=Brevibacillus TaxID=55080 RepID=UPI001492081B|nr:MULTISPECIES: hypothetical protein [Bacillales]MBR8659601.1 hypothetical protein [Brevibacillus sp. NL20B1]MDT3415635.1 hypothetical protein [Brevibacillus aydinogluensis]UFJ60665.1 hypothetical protein IRT44_15555 [Anoxybacillus sediminis]
MRTPSADENTLPGASDAIRPAASAPGRAQADREGQGEQAWLSEACSIALPYG